MKYLLSTQIAKRCPKGHWADLETGECITVEEWKRRYESEERDGGAEEQGRKRCPKGKIYDKESGRYLSPPEWRRKQKGIKEKGEKEKPSDEPPSDKPKEQEIIDESDKPFVEGITKAESVKKSKDITRKAVKEANANLYKEYTSDIKKMRKNVESIDWDNPKQSNSKIYATIFKEFSEKYGMDLKLSSAFAKMPKEVFKGQIENTLTMFEEHPILVARFNGFRTRSGDALMSCSFDNEIMYHMSDYASVESANSKSVGEVDAKDPITGERTDWFFHFRGGTRATAVFHEFGHALDNTLFALHEYTQGDYKADLFEGIDKSALASRISNEAILSGGMKPTSEIEDHGEYLSIKFKGKMYRDVWNEIGDICKEYGLKRENNLFGTGKRGECEVRITNPNAQNETKAKKFSELTQKDFVRMNEVTHYTLERGEKSQKYSIKRINECEALYKEIYGLSEIAPSDVYSKYGYYGTGWGNQKARYGEISFAHGSQSKERVAEAMEDVMTRKDKANSMSQLIVCHTEYELYVISTGDTDLSFRDYVKDKVGFDKFKDRIVKMPISRYMRGAN